MLVILEGLDNTGKTTIAKMLMQYYKIQGKNATLAKELEKLISSKILVINYDENEPNFGSSILQGIAYYYNKIIIAYETHQVDYYVDGGQHMGVNLMLEQSATKICKDYNELEKVVLEELKKVVKE